MKRLVLTTIGIVALVGCSTTTSPVTNGTTGTCTITLTGAQTGTFTCSNVSAVWNSSSTQGGFALSIAQAGSTPAITVGITFPGEPHVAHFTNTTTGTTGGASDSPSSQSFWIATNSSGTTPVGTYDLNLTSVSNAITVSTGKSYTVSGTLDATLPAVTGTAATGTVTMHVTF